MSQNHDKAKTESSLLADIEAFARSQIDLSTPGTMHQSSRGPATSAVSAPAPQPRFTPAVADTPVPSAPGGSLLDKLKREAVAKQMTESQRFLLQAQRKQVISAALERAFHYLRELTEQLNVLKPPSPHAYGLTTTICLDQLSWVEGRADFRLEPSASDNKFFDNVTLRYRLSGNRTLRIEKESPANESFRAALYDRGITFTEEELRNARGQVERTTFQFPCEVKAGVILAADYQAGLIRMQRRNIGRYGVVEYRLPAEALNQEMLEELAKLILGEPSQLDKLIQRTAGKEA